VVDYYVNYGSTVKMCSLDLSKAFDKMNHHGLFIKLMERHLPNKILSKYYLQLVSHLLNGATNFQRSLTCHVAFDKAGYCRHTCLPVSLTAWLTK